jgi:hypothetical protein
LAKRKPASAEPDSLLSRLPLLVPLAIDWAQELELHLLKTGKPLAFWQVADASDVGVRHPEKVRLWLVDEMPKVGNPALAAAALEIGFLGPETLGLTLGYGIFIKRTHAGRRWLLRHELRHVAQCEAAGGIEPFLGEYLQQVLRDGYQAAALEQDARYHETRQAGKQKPDSNCCDLP